MIATSHSPPHLLPLREAAWLPVPPGLLQAAGGAAFPRSTQKAILPFDLGYLDVVLLVPSLTSRLPCSGMLFVLSPGSDECFIPPIGNRQEFIVAFEVL
jgi:hypothetical protein